MCCSSEKSFSSDYKYILKAFNLSFSRKKLLYALCKDPTAHLHSRLYAEKHQLSEGGVRSGLKKLVAYNLVCKDSAGIWRIRNEGMQAWLYAVLTDSEQADYLRSGTWP